MNQVQVRSMQDIQNEMGISPESNQWQEFIIDTDSQAFTQEMSTTPGPAGTPNIPSEIIETTPPPTTNRIPPQTQTQSRPPTPAFREVEPGDFTAQLISLRDLNRINEIRGALSAAGYNTEIQQAEVNGVTMYRLRLAGSFSRSYTEYLAQKIQSEFSEINDFWVMRR